MLPVETQLQNFTLSDVPGELENDSRLVSNPALIHPQGVRIMSLFLTAHLQRYFIM